MMEGPMMAEHAIADPVDEEMTWTHEEVITTIEKSAPDDDEELWLTADFESIPLPPDWIEQELLSEADVQGTAPDATSARWVTLAMAGSPSYLRGFAPQRLTRRTIEALEEPTPRGPEVPWMKVGEIPWTKVGCHAAVGEQRLLVLIPEEGEPCEWSVAHTSDPTQVLRGTAPTEDLARLIALTVARSYHAPGPFREEDLDDIG